MLACDTGKAKSYQLDCSRSFWIPTLATWWRSHNFNRPRCRFSRKHFQRDKCRRRSRCVLRESQVDDRRDAGEIP